MNVLTSPAVVLATQGPNPKDVVAGWTAFAIFIGLCVAVLLLWLSFRKQLKKIDFEEEPDEPRSKGDGDQVADPAEDSSDHPAKPS
jgi:hypothetical protein